MQLPISTRSRFPFQPRGEGGNTYYLAVPSVLDVEDFQVELRAKGFTYPTNDALLDIIVDELTQRGPAGPPSPENPGGVLKFALLIDMVEDVRRFSREQADLAIGDRENLPTETAEAFAELERKMTATSEEYRRALAQRTGAMNKLALIAFSQFVRNWTVLDADGKPIPFPMGDDGKITEEGLGAALARDREEIIAVGFKAHSLTVPGADTRKNSPSLSRSRMSPAASPKTAQRTAAPAGKSTASSTRKTPRKT